MCPLTDCAFPDGAEKINKNKKQEEIKEIFRKGAEAQVYIDKYILIYDNTVWCDCVYVFV